MSLEDELRPFLVPIPEYLNPKAQFPWYEVPVGEPVLEQVEQLTTDEWFQRLARHPTQAWDERLAINADASLPERMAAEGLSRYEPATIFFGRYWIHCGITAKGARIKTPPLLYLGPRYPAGRIDKILVNHDFTEAKPLASFVEMLNGFQHLKFIGSGIANFNDSDCLITGENCQNLFGMDLEPEWDPSVLLLHGGNGDHLLMNREGECGWFQLETHEDIIPYCESLEVFAEAFKNHLVMIADYYLTNEPERWIMPFDSFDCERYLP